MPRELKPFSELSRTGKKYREDPEYREQMKEYSAKKVKEEREKKLKEKANFKKRGDRDVKGAWNPRIVYGIKVYNKTATADYINVSSVSIYNWEKKDILPEPTLKDELDRSWFSWDYIEALRKVLKNRLRGSLDKFKDNLYRVFLQKGIIDREGNNIELDEFIDKGASKKKSITQNFSLNKKSELNQTLSTQTIEHDLTSSSNF